MIGQAPERQQRWPTGIAVLAPDTKQGHAMIDLAGLPQPYAGFGGTALLQPPQKLGVVARRVPQPPCGHTRGMPCCVFVRPVIPQFLMPAEAIDRLTARAAEARPAREFLFAI